MKKRGLLFFFILVFFGIALLASASAAANSSNSTGVDKAYQCLTNKVNGNCASLTDEEKAFSLWSIGKCQSDLISDAKSPSTGQQCWPNTGCSIKTTSEAILALNNVGADTTNAQNWLLSETAVPTQILWYLEIVSNATTCNIQYSGSSYTVNINSDKTLSSSAGSCLTLSPSGYLLQVSPSCYSKNFSISCQNDFLTTTLFQQSGSSTIYVSDQSSSAASGGTTTEAINSSCFSTGTGCDYEGTLWASLALNSLGKDVSPYLPYLITMAGQNERFLPEAFLYALTAKPQYETSLLSLQQSNEYWMESGDKYYDTALALYPLQQETQQQKTNAQNWLLGSQGTDGCWNNGNIRDTAFVLLSSWPQQFSSGGGSGAGLPDCTTAGHNCVSSSLCPQSDTLSSYQCTSATVCCSALPSCSALGGTLCQPNQICSISGTQETSSDSTFSTLCCVPSGTCITPSNNNSSPATSADCTSNGGTCRTGGCNTGEQANANYQCTLSTDTCCTLSLTPSSSGGGSSLWIWILLILIVLAALGIIFRKKIRAMIFKEGGKPASRTGPGAFPPRAPYYPSRPLQRMPERRIMIPQQRPQPQPVRRPSKSQSELDDVLKKLKEMGK